MDKQEAKTRLNKAYQIINQFFFFGAMPDMDIDILGSDQIRGDIAGQYSRSSKLIVISEQAASRSIEEQLDDLFHEMIHAYDDIVLNKKDFVHDFTDNSCYHTHQFLITALVFGGYCKSQPDEILGYSDVSLRPENKKLVLYELHKQI